MTGRGSIDDLQRDDESGRLLRAFTAEYRRAKQYHGLRMGVSLLLALAGPVVSIASLTAAGVVGAAAGLWVLVTRLVLIPVERRHVKDAAHIQERFDTRLFDLPWPEALAGQPPSEEDIADAARRLREDRRVARQQDEGWYPTTEGLPRPVDVLVAQWANVAYGRHQNRAYFHFIVGTTTSLGIAVIAIGVIAKMALTDWLITFALPSLPALLDVSELADAHRRIALGKRIREVDQLQPLWQAELAIPGRLTVEDCRRIQDASYKLRVLGLQVPDWFFWLHRARSEANMREAAAVRREQFLKAWKGNCCAG